MSNIFSREFPKHQGNLIIINNNYIVTTVLGGEHKQDWTLQCILEKYPAFAGPLMSLITRANITTTSAAVNVLTNSQERIGTNKHLSLL